MENSWIDDVGLRATTRCSQVVAPRAEALLGFAVEIIGQDWSGMLCILDEKRAGVKHAATSTCAGDGL